MVEYGRTDCLTHMLTEKFLQRKWERYGLIFYSISFMMYMAFLFLIVFIIVTHPSCIHKDFDHDHNHVENLCANNTDLETYVSLFDLN